MNKTEEVYKDYKVEAIGGVCMLFKKDRLFEVGLFDSAYFNGCEDMDICLSLRNKGYRVLHSPALIWHYGEAFRGKPLTFLRSFRPPNYEHNWSYFYSKWNL